MYATGSRDRGFVQSDFLKFKDGIELSDIGPPAGGHNLDEPCDGKTTSAAASCHISSGSSQGKAEMVYCELCGGWYETGNVFRNHFSPGRG